MMDCLHAYAECLQVDADLMIEDYVRERDKCLRKARGGRGGAGRRDRRPAIPTEAEPRLRFSPWLVALVVVAIAVLTVVVDALARRDRAGAGHVGSHHSGRTAAALVEAAGRGRSDSSGAASERSRLR